MHIQCEHAVTAEVQNGVVLYAVSASHIVIAVYYVVIVGKASTQQDGTQNTRCSKFTRLFIRGNL